MHAASPDDPFAHPDDLDAETELSDYTVGPREQLCTTCWLIHRVGQDCDE